MTLTWEGESRWIETTVGVLGEAGRTHCLPPSIRAHKRRERDAVQLPYIQVRACQAGCLHGHGAAWLRNSQHVLESQLQQHELLPGAAPFARLPVEMPAHPQVMRMLP